MSIGDNIRKIRKFRNLTQKELGDLVQLSDDRIRHYELGDRTPKENKILDLAYALNVSEFAIKEPDLDSYIGIIHALFYLEDKFGLTLEDINGELKLSFKNAPYNTSQAINEYLYLWQDAIKRSLPTEKDTTEEIEQKKYEYDRWRYSFPKDKTKQDNLELFNAYKKYHQTKD